jgi:hypothetical protein
MVEGETQKGVAKSVSEGSDKGDPASPLGQAGEMEVDNHGIGPKSMGEVTAGISENQVVGGEREEKASTSDLGTLYTVSPASMVDNHADIPVVHCPAFHTADCNLLEGPSLSRMSPDGRDYRGREC